MARQRLNSAAKAQLEHEPPAPTKVAPEVIPTGCTILDCALGGGWGEGRIFNIVGDKSSGKTLLAIEAAANFIAKHPNGQVRYGEAEAAFDNSYAAGLGFPVEQVTFPADEREFLTIEDFFEDLMEQITWSADTGCPLLYIVDSLDALSTRTEMSEDIDKGTYGTEKAKQLSRLFRQVVQPLRTNNVTLGVISQIRDKLNVTFGKKTTRAGGKALAFYCSQIVELQHIGRLKRTRKGVERVVGINARAAVEKNKLGAPFRTADFPIYFSYGIEDLEASVRWLQVNNQLDAVGWTGAQATAYIKRITTMDQDEYRVDCKEIGAAVREAWGAIEHAFQPTRSKYDG